MSGNREQLLDMFDEYVRGFFASQYGDDIDGKWVRLEELERGRMVVEFPYNEKIALEAPGGLGGIVNAGFMASLVDVGGFALRTTFDDPESVAVITTDINITYLRPATGDLLVEYDVLSSGSSVGATAATYYSTSPDGDPKQVAAGRGTFFLD